MKQITRILFILFLCLAVGCEKYNPVPRVGVDFSIEPDNVMYLNLNIWGGHEYLTGGVNGIVVYRLNGWSFSAFDRACPYDWDDPDEPRIFVEDNGIILCCPRCGSQYNILDGSVITGLSEYPLRQYYTRYDGVKLRVHS